jgi:hypothetical protein
MSTLSEQEVTDLPTVSVCIDAQLKSSFPPTTHSSDNKQPSVATISYPQTASNNTYTNDCILCSKLSPYVLEHCPHAVNPNHLVSPDIFRLSRRRTNILPIKLITITPFAHPQPIHLNTTSRYNAHPNPHPLLTRCTGCGTPLPFMRTTIDDAQPCTSTCLNYPGCILYG